MSLADNRKVRQLYELIEFFEAGLVLNGPEVKSIRNGKVSFADSYVDFKDGEALVIGLHIAYYEQGTSVKQEPTRPRKLLLHKREINTLARKVEQKGLTVVPVNLHLKNGKIKLEIALARGKNLHDKRHDLKDRAEKRDLERELVRHG